MDMLDWVLKYCICISYGVLNVVNVYHVLPLWLVFSNDEQNTSFNILFSVFIGETNCYAKTCSVM